MKPVLTEPLHRPLLATLALLCALAAGDRPAAAKPAPPTPRAEPTVPEVPSAPKGGLRF